jgi:Tfp pilus assembly protein PilF
LRAVLAAAMLGWRVVSCEDHMSESGELFRKFDELLSWGREQAAGGLVEAVREAQRTQPAGCAIVGAAVDWQLAGFDQLGHQRPISREDLRALFPSYLAELAPGRPATEQAFRQGLGWASTPVGRDGPAPLDCCATAVADHCPARDVDGFHACWWLVEDAERRGRRVPAAAWALFVSRVRPGEAVAVGVAAFGQGDLGAAERALRVAIDAEDPQQGPLAACRLGLLRLHQGDTAGARAAFRLAVASGHAEAGPEAAVWLGGLLARHGDRTAARAVLRRAVASGHYWYAPEAALTIGTLLAEHGGVAEATGALKRQAAAGEEDLSPRAALLLGSLLGAQGDLPGARGWLERAIRSGHFDAAPRASLALGGLLAANNDPEQVGCFRQAAAGASREVAAQAALCLADYYAEQGDDVARQAAYQQAIDSGDPDHAPRAALLAGRLQERRGDLSGAWAAYQLAIDAHHPSWSPAAAARLGQLLAGRGDERHARAAWQQAARQPRLEPAAAFQLAVVCERWRARDLAEATYQRVLDCGHHAAAPLAALQLGLLYGRWWRRGDAARARSCLQLAIDSGHEQVAPLAQIHLRGLDRRTRKGMPRARRKPDHPQAKAPRSLP